MIVELLAIRQFLKKHKAKDCVIKGKVIEHGNKGDAMTHEAHTRPNEKVMILSEKIVIVQTLFAAFD